MNLIRPISSISSVRVSNVKAVDPQPALVTYHIASFLRTAGKVLIITGIFFYVLRWVTQKILKFLPPSTESSFSPKTTKNNSVHSISLLSPEYRENGWLGKKVEYHIQTMDSSQDKDYFSFAFINQACRDHSNWDLSIFFSTRADTSETIAKRSTADLLNMPGDEFFTIIDLVSGQQAMDILKNENASGNRKMGLYFFNTHLAFTFANRIKVLSEEAIDEKTQQAATNTLLSLKNIQKMTYSSYEPLLCLNS